MTDARPDRTNNRPPAATTVERVLLIGILLYNDRYLFLSFLQGCDVVLGLMLSKTRLDTNSLKNPDYLTQIKSSRLLGQSWVPPPVLGRRENV